jgi:Holliday junction DNA helicase RuvA
LAGAVASEDVALISSVPGIGKKTAQRIILDLADKLGVPELGAGAAQKAVSGAALAEATDALLAMGFSASEAAVAVKGFAGEGEDAQDLIRHALRRLGGGS